MKRYATWYNNLGDNFMIQIPDNSTILAPATLHLSLYKEILKQKKRLPWHTSFNFIKLAIFFLSWTNKIRY